MHNRTSGRRAFAAAFAVVALVAGCSSSTVNDREDGTEDGSSTVASTVPAISSPSSVAPSTAKKPWTVLVYSMADTDLEPFMMKDIDEMGRVGTGDNLNIVALVDRATDHGDDPVLDLGDWVGAKLVEVGVGVGKVLKEYGDINTGDPQVLADFVAAGVQRYPADNYALIISDHGAAWPGVGGDESADNDTLTLPEMSEAITTGLQAAGTEKLALLGFDACLMATYEVASRLAPLADRMVASQELEPGHGWDYNALQLLQPGTAVTVDELGNAILDGYRAQAIAEGEGANITLSLLDLTKVAPLDTAVDAFARSLAGRAADLAPKVGRVRTNTFSYGRSPDSEEDAQMVDLGDLVARIGVEALDVSDEADALIRAQNDVVRRSIEGPAAIKSTGLSVYFPTTESLYDATYADVVGDSPWRSFIAAYFDAGEAIPVERRPRFKTRNATSSETNVVESVSGLVTISATLEPGQAPNIVETVVRYGIAAANGSINFLGEEFGTAFADGTDTVSGDYDLTTFTLSDGRQTVNAYALLDVDADNGLATIDVPMVYYPPGRPNEVENVLLSITFDTATSTVSDETYYVYNDRAGTYGELVIEAGGQLAPDVLVVAADGSETWSASPVRLDADPARLEYEFVDLAAGTTLYVELIVTDFGGNEATTGSTVTVV
jgi:hypothetical protein